MKKRLAEDFGIKHVEVRTFHSYGVRLLTKFKPDTPTDPPKQAEVGQEVKKILDDLLKNDRTFAKLVLDYAVEISDTTKEEADFEDETAYYEYLRQQEYVTLKGSEEVKSVAERDIANFLFINGVPYEYEPRARWAKSGKGRRSSNPISNCLGVSSSNTEVLIELAMFLLGLITQNRQKKTLRSTKIG